MVEPQPSKLMAWVRFPLPAPVNIWLNKHMFCHMQEFFAHIAQSVEHFLGKEEVTGSIPVVGTS